MACKIRGIVIGGPTGVGKTDLAVQLAQRLNGELISCDSVQVYTDLTIGANKTSTPVPQHLLNLTDWRSPFTAADFLGHCWRAIKEVVERGRVPILVGGTGFYFDWVVKGRPGAPPTDPLVLAKVEGLLKDDPGWEESLDRLRAVDEEYAKVLTKNDFYRLKRALVVHQMTGKPLSSFKDRKRSKEEIDVDWRCFYMTVADRMSLLDHLDRRCEKMIESGLISEVQELQKQGFGPDCQAGRAIGYKEVLDFLTRLKEIPREEWDSTLISFIGEFQSQTRQYTRKQEKWFYGMDCFKWVERPSLVQDLPSSLVDKIVRLFELSTDHFNEQPPDTDILRECTEFREQCRLPSTERSKRLRTFKSVLTIYNDPETRASLLNDIYKPLHRPT